MKIQVTPGCGKMIPKPSIGHFRPKNQRYYNYSLNDEGEPWGEDRVCTVQRDQFHVRMLIKTPWIHLVDDKPKAKPKATPKVKKDE